MQTAALLQADPRVAKVAAQIRAQQKIVAPRGIVIPDGYVDDMARAFVQFFGISDARDLSATWVDVTGESEGASQTNYEYFFTRKGVPLAPDWSNEIARAWVNGPDGTDATVGFGTTFDGRFDYVFRWIPSLGVPIFAVIPHEDITFWGGFAQWALTAATLAGLPGIIGEAIFGADFAAVNPALSNAIGKASMQLVLTGGDVGRSLVGAVAAVGGAEAGSFVGSAVDSAAIGSVAQAATSAAIEGKDASKAALRAAFFGSVRMWPDDDGTTLTETTLEDIGLSADVLEQLDALQYLEGVGLTGDELFADAGGSLITVEGEVAEAGGTEWAGGYYTDSGGNVRDLTNRIVIPAGEAAGLSDGEIADRLFNDWMVVQAQVVTTQPGDVARPADLPQPTKQTRVPTITDTAKTADALLKTAVSIANSIKLITTGRPLTYQTNPYGMPRTVVPGMPITRPDGSIVTNNGNGTQTIRYPDGRVQTTSTSYAPGGYGGSLIPGVSNQALLIGGAILVGAVLLARRK